MLRLLPVVLALMALPAVAQHSDHSHGQNAEDRVRTGLAQGLQVDPLSPAPGSPIARAFAAFDDVYIHVTYSAPFKRGRVVYGGVVGMGSLWAVGAHFATEIVTTAPLRMSGQVLPAGVYSLFATPDETMWTIHLNSGLGMHQTARYSPENDILTARIPVERLDDVVQQLTLDFEEAEDGVDLRISWDQTRVRLPMRPVATPR